jgi:spore maturation protein SpmB
MCTFLTINTASIQLLPTTAISILAVAGAKDATGFVPAAVLGTAIALACGVAAAKVLEKLPAFAPPPPDVEPEAKAAPVAEAAPLEEATPAPLTPLKQVILGLHGMVFVMLFVVIFAPEAMAWVPRLLGQSWRYAELFPDLAVGEKPILRVLKSASLLAVPWLLTFLPLYAALRGVKVYEQFTEGAKEAFATATRIIPFLVAMLVSIRMLREAGVIQAMTDTLGPWLARIGFPADLLPLALLRPLSGSATQGIFIDLVKTSGPDSLVAKMAATIYGSTETTFYVLAVYFGSVGIRRTRHAVLAGLTADIVAMTMAVLLCRLMFT